MNMPAPPQADGYVTEIAYLPGYYRELNPSILTLALNRKGFDTWKRGTPFTYLELGAGYALSTLIHAAANPQAQFIVIDVLPDHILTARAIAEAAQLKNVTFIEGSFAGLHEMALPQCDFITMHGVWSWINDDNRAHILRCLDAHLKPGGVLSLSYNTLPGCSPILPMRELMVAQYATTQGPLPDRMASAIAFADTLKQVRGGYFIDNPMAYKRFEDLKGRPRNYLAHEYFNANWTTFYHADVVASMRPLGLSFVTQASIFDSIEELHFSSAALALLNKTSDPTLRETLGDFLVNRQFRVDVFVREGAVRGDADELVRNTRFTALAPPQDLARFKRRTTLGDIEPPRTESVAILTALMEKPATIAELAKHSSLQALPIAELTRLVYVLTGFGAIETAGDIEGHEARSVTVRLLNRALRERNRGGMWSGVNASSVTGGGVHTMHEDQIFLLMRHEKNPVAESARILGDTEAAIEPYYRDFVAQRLPRFISMGVD